MIVFLDTEFTGPLADPKLLSVGIVPGARNDKYAGDDTGLEFYAEVTDRERLDAASWFVLEAVLPQFGRVPGAACPYAELGARLYTFFANLAHSLAPAEAIEVAFEFDLDWALVERAIEAADAARWPAVAGLMHPVNVYDIAGFGAGKRAATTYFAAHRLAPLSRHHALCDARALRASHRAAQAAEAAHAGASPCALPHRPQAPPFATTDFMAMTCRAQTESAPTGKP